MLNEDYRDILRALNAEGVEFLVVGAYALAAHGYPRATMDIDLWVRPSPTNADAVLRALQNFGAPLRDLTKADLLRDDTVFQIGTAPRRIDLLTGATGLEFASAWAHSLAVEVAGIPLRILALDDMIQNKKATGRTKDLADVEMLESLKNSSRQDRPESG